MQQTTTKSRNSFLKQRGELLVGVLIGGLIAFSFLFYNLRYSVKESSDLYSFKSETNTKLDTVKVGNYTLEIKARNEIKIKEQNEILNEKINSLNDRIGDVYLSLTIIITLLIAMIATIYFKTESEVAKHMFNNYGKYKSDLEEMVAAAQQILSEMKTKSELTEQFKLDKNKQGIQKTEEHTN